MSELARFLFQRSDYSPSNRVVKPGAFLPKNGQTSVFDVDGSDFVSVGAIGEDVGRVRGPRLHGWGGFAHQDVTKVGLWFERDDEPPRHGNLLGWPPHGVPELKARAKAIAVELAARAELVLMGSR